MESETNLKRPVSSPTNKEDKKTKDDLGDMCIVCAKEATGDVFECLWCEAIQYASCSCLSTEQCNAITNMANVNIVFFCTSCLRALPIALKQYENQSHIVNYTEPRINSHQKNHLNSC